MTSRRLTSLSIACLALASLSLPAAASLTPRLFVNGTPMAYYDSALDISWLADANYAQTVGAPGSGSNGTFRSWYDAMAWVDDLSVNGVTGWRMPHMDTTCGFPNYGSCNRLLDEFHYLFMTELQGSYGYSITDAHGPNYDLFRNIQSYVYWSETEFSVSPGWVSVWSSQAEYPGTAPKIPIFPVGAPYFVWAVHDGDVGARPVISAPTTLMLVLLGLCAVQLSRRGNGTGA
ncbi:MAG: hypothetical protein JNK55_21930 [Rubrivivax sp.]|nr:hypothetical protein [Rubrivivax sp.]